jgi:hypothetical protein
MHTRMIFKFSGNFKLDIADTTDITITNCLFCFQFLTYVTLVKHTMLFGFVLIQTLNISKLFVAFVTVKMIIKKVSWVCPCPCDWITSLPQVSHTNNKPSLECVLQWRLKLCGCLNVSLQIQHSKLWSLLGHSKLDFSFLSVRYFKLHAGGPFPLSIMVSDGIWHDHSLFHETETRFHLVTLLRNVLDVLYAEMKARIAMNLIFITFENQSINGSV